MVTFSKIEGCLILHKSFFVGKNNVVVLMVFKPHKDHFLTMSIKHHPNVGRTFDDTKPSAEHVFLYGKVLQERKHGLGKSVFSKFCDKFHKTKGVKIERLTS